VCEAAWPFFGGVFAVVIRDNTKAIVVGPDPHSPRITPAFLEYARARHFHSTARACARTWCFDELVTDGESVSAAAQAEAAGVSLERTVGPRPTAGALGGSPGAPEWS